MLANNILSDAIARGLIEGIVWTIWLSAAIHVLGKIRPSLSQQYHFCGQSGFLPQFAFWEKPNQAYPRNIISMDNLAFHRNSHSGKNLTKPNAAISFNGQIWLSATILIQGKM
jgi:hypothetical protein